MLVCVALAGSCGGVLLHERVIGRCLMFVWQPAADTQQVGDGLVLHVMPPIKYKRELLAEAAAPGWRPAAAGEAGYI